MKKYRMQLIFGLPVLAFAMIMIALDSAKVISVEKFGYAFFGSLVTLFVNYFFRKSPPKEESLNNPPSNGENRSS